MFTCIRYSALSRFHAIVNSNPLARMLLLSTSTVRAGEVPGIPNDLTLQQVVNWTNELAPYEVDKINLAQDWEDTVLGECSTN